MNMVGHRYIGSQQCVPIPILWFVWLFMVIWEKIMLNRYHVFKKKPNKAISILSYTLVSIFTCIRWNLPLSSVLGDMAYDMDYDNARYGDQYMNSIEPIAAYIPYMTCPGNHEQA